MKRYTGNFPSATFERIYQARVELWTAYFNGQGPAPGNFMTWLEGMNPDKATLKDYSWIRENARKRAEDLFARL